ncbi:malonate decarboxylase holo-ACP synthase (plasmid) [Streptomyces sp. BI20]|uniref:malonate decarboxylase holo-ACP synthase n=1 Tax=Streptomyces sp. BI20 TaxID=3403460 RepID=UPI003C74073B
MTGPGAPTAAPRPHDLLRITDPARVLPADPARDPEALRAALNRAPWVVVRRDTRDGRTLPVGVRGSTRAARWAARVPLDAVAETLTPAALLRRARPPHRDLPALHALAALAGRPRPAWVRSWGPGGSTAFELATGAPTVGPGSDLDLVADTPEPVTPDEAARLLTALAHLTRHPVRVDLQLQTPHGAVAAAELARDEGRVLLRTDTGPFLVTDPWAPPPPAEPR